MLLKYLDGFQQHPQTGRTHEGNFRKVDQRGLSSTGSLFEELLLDNLNAGNIQATHECNVRQILILLYNTQFHHGPPSGSKRHWFMRRSPFEKKKRGRTVNRYSFRLATNRYYQ